MATEKRRAKRRPRLAPGTAPGTLSVDPSAPRPVLSVIAYGPEALHEAAGVSLDDVRALKGQHPVLWLNVDGLGDAELIRQLGELFGLHRLALEDVVNGRQRPKVEQFGDCVFIIEKMIHAGSELHSEQLSLFLGDGWVVSFQEQAGDCLEPVRRRLREGRGRIRGAGADYLAYALIDAVVDSYFPALEGYGERLEELEDAVMTTPDSGQVAQIHQIKRDLLAFRRAVWPLREVLSSLYREPHALVTEETRVYLRDCYDHTVQIVDLVETYRELGSGLMDAYLSALSNKMNEVMQVLSIVATIFIPLTFVAGLYGMNFNPEVSPWNMPELSWRYGYPVALGVMLTLGLGLYWVFRRKGWIGKAGARRR